MKATRVVFLTLCLFILALPLTAQNLKIGGMDSSVIIKAHPDYSAGEQILKAYVDSLSSELNALKAEQLDKVKAYQAKEAVMTQDAKEAAQAEIMSLDEKISNYSDDARRKANRRENELLKAIMDKVDAAVKEVAKEKGYDYILDYSSSAVLFSSGKDDVTPLIKAKLGMK